MKKTYWSAIFVMLILVNCLCTAKESDLRTIHNRKPKYKNSNSISLTLIYTLDLGTPREYYISDASWLDLDNFGNLYVLDGYEGKISVFDSSSAFIKSFGRTGQGPRELNKPRSISILDNRVYIWEKSRGVKIWSLDGDYIDFIPLVKPNLTAIKASDDYFAGLSLIFDQNNPNLRRWSLIKYTRELKESIPIAQIEKEFDYFNLFSKTFINAFDSKQNLYFPERDDEYIIKKYDMNGKLLFAFGRDYDSKPYSKELREWAVQHWGSSVIVPKHPPIVRCVLIDDKDLIWVVTGECFLDCDSDLKIESRIDLFNEDGEFLYTFNSSAPSRISIIRNSRLYSGSSAGDNKVKVG